MVPAGVELIACRVDVVAEWCYCICAFSGGEAFYAGVSKSVWVTFICWCRNIWALSLNFSGFSVVR